MQNILKKSAYSFLAVILAISLMIPLGVGNAQRNAWADEISTQAAGDVNLTIHAGAATPVPNQQNMYYFPGLKVEAVGEGSSNPIKSITVQFTSAITENDEVYFENDGNFKVWDINKHGNKSVNNESGASIDDWETYLRNNLKIKLSDETTTKSLRMIASFEPVNRTLDYNSFNGHYYEVAKNNAGTNIKCGWSDALNLSNAAHTEYLGLKGYLVTVTSQEEHDFVYSLVQTDSWMGGTCDYNFAGFNSSWAQNYPTYDSSNPTRWARANNIFTNGDRATYYWVSGPEAGLEIGGARLFYAQHADTDYWRANNPETNQPMFMNFNPALQPDGSGGREKYIQFNASYKGLWNDLPNDYSLEYVIEYGGMPNDNEDTSGTGSSDTNVDVYVKVEIKINPRGTAITTEAEDVAVGQPLNIRESVNGGPITTHLDSNRDGEKKPAELTREFRELVSGDAHASTAVWSDLVCKMTSEDGGETWKVAEGREPKAAGTYQVKTSGIFSEIDGEKTPFEEDGVATFKINPVAIDVTNPVSEPGIEPDDPNGGKIDNGDGTQAVVTNRTFSKIYDGNNTSFAKGNFDIQDVLRQLLGSSYEDGVTDVYLTYDSATSDSANAGEANITLHGAKLAGKDAGSYTLSGLDKDGNLVVKGSIFPRDLVIKSDYVKDGSSIMSWVKDRALASNNDADTLTDTLFTNNASNYVEGSATKTETVEGKIWPVEWPSNMLAPGDDIESVLGKVSYSAKTKGGLSLDAKTPQLGTYELVPSFENVMRDNNGTYYTKTEDGKPGNYRVIFENANLEVTDRPVHNLTTDPEGNPNPITIDEPQKPKGTPPVTKDDIEKIVEDKFNPDGSDPDKRVPKDIEPVITIKKGGTVIPEIDPSEPGEYVITVVYPDPDGTDTEVEIIYTIEPDPIASDPNNQIFTISTKLKGAVDGATITPSQAVGKGSNAHVSWQAGPYAYIALVEVDGRAVSGKSDFSFDQVNANHEVVVTLAQMPELQPSHTNGFYTVTVNKYGGAKGATVSPSAIVNSGESSRITWEADPGYEINQVLIDGKALDADAVKAGAYTFANMNANHVVDVVYAPVGSNPKLTQDDLTVTTKIKGGPGTITAGSTVAKGEDYNVAWQPVIQTTVDFRSPNYAVYEVEKIEVNGKEAVGKDEKELTLSNIKENKEVVVTVKPVIYNVTVVKYGSGKVSPSVSRYKGQEYIDIMGEPTGTSHISYISVDDKTIFDESVAGGNTGQGTQAGTQSVLDVLSASVNAVTKQVLPDVDIANPAQPVQPDQPEQTEQGGAVTNPAPSVEPSQGSEEVNDPTVEPADSANDEAAVEAESKEAADVQAADEATVEAQALELVATQDALAGNATPQFKPEQLSYTQADTNLLNMGISGIADNHVIKVYFAEKDQKANPETTKDTSVTIVPGIEGGPGTIIGGGIVDITPGNPNPPTVKYDIPDTHEPTKVVINGTEYDLHEGDKGDKEINIADYVPVNPGTEYTVTLVTEKRVPGDDEIPQTRESAKSDQTESFMISTNLKGGAGTISASASIDKGKDYTVTWSAGEHNGIKYRVAKVLIDGVEHPELINETSYTFTDISAEHSIEVVLEPIPNESQAASTGTDKTDDKSGSETPSSTSKTGDINQVIVPVIGGVASIALIALLVARRKRGKAQK